MCVRARVCVCVCVCARVCARVFGSDENRYIDVTVGNTPVRVGLFKDRISSQPDVYCYDSFFHICAKYANRAGVLAPPRAPPCVDQNCS